MTKRMIAIVTGFLVLSAGSAAQAQAGTADDAGSACVNHTVATFDVRASSAKSRYRTGDTARIVVIVERAVKGPALERSAAEAHHRAVQGAYVGVAIMAGYHRLVGLAVTDETGRAVVEIEIPKRMPEGWAVVGGRAWKDIVSEPCPITEEGMLRPQKMFRITSR